MAKETALLPEFPYQTPPVLLLFPYINDLLRTLDENQLPSHDSLLTSERAALFLFSAARSPVLARLHQGGQAR